MPLPDTDTAYQQISADQVIAWIDEGKKHPDRMASMFLGLWARATGRDATWNPFDQTYEPEQHNRFDEYYRFRDTAPDRAPKRTRRTDRIWNGPATPPDAVGWGYEGDLVGTDMTNTGNTNPGSTENADDH